MGFSAWRDTPDDPAGAEERARDMRIFEWIEKHAKRLVILSLSVCLLVWVGTLIWIYLKGVP